MEACYAEGSKSRGDAVPQISLRPLAHQNCIRRDRIVAVAPTNGDPEQSFGLVSSFKLTNNLFACATDANSSGQGLGMGNVDWQYDHRLDPLGPCHRWRLALV